MKALVLEAYRKLVFTDVPRPELREEKEVLIRVKAAAICGSDVHGIDGSTGRRKPPLIMGHEASGVIEAVGREVAGYQVGDRVTFDSTEYCGACFHCRRGEINLCDNRRVLGVSCDEYRRDGAFAEYIVVPERILYKIPDGLGFIDAALAEPVAVAAHAAAITPLGLNESIAVVGAGLIGLLLLQILRPSCSGLIVALDVEPRRLEAARGFGADVTLNASQAGAVEQMRRLTAGRGIDRAFEAVGYAAPIGAAISCLRKGGSLTLIGNASPRIDFPLQTVVTRELAIFGSCASAGEYEVALDLMARKKINAAALVSAVAPLADGALWFERLYNREPGLLKVVLEPLTPPGV